MMGSRSMPPLELPPQLEYTISRSTLMCILYPHTILHKCHHKQQAQIENSFALFSSIGAGKSWRQFGLAGLTFLCILPYWT